MSIRIDTSRLGRDAAALGAAFEKAKAAILGERTMLALGVQAATIIKGRTGQGRDADGAGFAPYTPGYAAYRSKKGRGTRPDLTFSGRMLKNIHAKFVSAGKAVIYFLSSAEANKAVGNSRKRDFFDIRNDKEQAALERELVRQVDARMREAGLI